MKILLLALICASLAQSGMTMSSFSPASTPISWSSIKDIIINFVRQILLLVENVKTLLPQAAKKIIANLVEDFRPAITRLEQIEKDVLRPKTDYNNVVHAPNFQGVTITGGRVIIDGGNNPGTEMPVGPYTGKYVKNCDITSKNMVRIFGHYYMNDGNRKGKKLVEIRNKGDNGVDVRIRNEGIISKYHYDIPASYISIDQDNDNGIAITIAGANGSRHQYCWL